MLIVGGAAASSYCWPPTENTPLELAGPHTSRFFDRANEQIQIRIYKYTRTNTRSYCASLQQRTTHWSRQAPTLQDCLREQMSKCKYIYTNTQIKNSRYKITLYWSPPGKTPVILAGLHNSKIYSSLESREENRLKRKVRFLLSFQQHPNFKDTTRKRILYTIAHCSMLKKLLNGWSFGDQ